MRTKKTRPYKKWTTKEKNDLLNLISKHPENFSEAYRIHAEKYNRKKKDVEFFFQRYRKKEGAKVCTVLIGKNRKCSPNRKNIYSKTGGYVKPLKQTIWKQIINLLFNK